MFLVDAKHSIVANTACETKRLSARSNFTLMDEDVGSPLIGVNSEWGNLRERGWGNVRTVDADAMVD